MKRYKLKCNLKHKLKIYREGLQLSKTKNYDKKLHKFKTKKYN